MSTTNDALALPGSVRSDVVERLFQWPGYVLFFMMLFVPTVYQPIKGVLLAATVGTILLRALGTGRIALHPLVVALTCVFTAVGLFFLARGTIAGNPGAIRMSTVYVLWPMVYVVLVAGAADPIALRRIFRLMVWATILISLYSVHYVLWELGVWPDSLYLRLDLGHGFSDYGGALEFNLYSISSLIFLVPFLMAAALYLPRGEVPVRRLTLWGALALGMLTALLTGRRGLLVALPMGPIVGFVLWMNQPGRVRRLSRRTLVRSVAAGVALLVGLIVYLDVAHGLTVRALVAMVATGFDFAWDPIARQRADQLAALQEGWLESPWFGTGHGAPAPGVIRSEEMPWAYELAYMALLMHVGLVGVAIYGAGVGWIYAMGMRSIRSGARGSLLVLPMLSGTSAFLVANATNPYLEKYDYLWVLFLPLAYINYWLLTGARDAARQP